MLATVYPFMNKYLKRSFTKDGSEYFFMDLMNKAIEYREKNNIKSADLLEHLINLRRKKEISGKNFIRKLNLT